jgi:hypothetical protein
MPKKLNAVTTRPCPHCPFRRDVPGFLSRYRAQQIADSLDRGQSFTCHETNDYPQGGLARPCDDETGEAIVTIDSIHCAGAALILEAEGNPNQLMQVAERLRYYIKPTGSELVFRSLEEFVEHHSF